MSKNQKHGLSKHPLYMTWAGMVHRCHNPKSTSWKNYGARGIAVCDEWRASFVAFVSDMGERPSSAHTLDRIDNDGDYRPGNCRWATAAQQAENRLPQQITLSVRLSPTEMQEFTTFVRSRGLTRTEVVRELIREYLTRHEKPLD